MNDKTFLVKRSIKQTLIYPADDFLTANCATIYQFPVSIKAQR